jgi:membrane fusion protein (multidrug efflux system)
MPWPFPQTARSLARESPALARLTAAAGALLLAGWGAWFSLARVPVYETSQTARLEMLRATQPVDSPVDGRVVDVHVTLDGNVTEGDALVVLDASAQTLALDQARVKIAGIDPQLEALRKEADSERAALDAYQRQLGADLTEAESRVHEAEVMARAGELEAARSDRLFGENLISDADRLRAHAESERRIAAKATAQAALEKLRRQSSTGAEDRRSHIVSLDREAASLAAELALLKASMPERVHDVEIRTVRAPASGHIGETANVRVGQVLARGGHVATIVAPGDLRVVASFSPTAFGRVRPGQAARVRLDAFPWAEYGTLGATVTHVARELSEGSARIELTVEPASATRIPLQHALPGSVDVVVDEATPATLVLRAAGRHGT